MWTLIKSVAIINHHYESFKMIFMLTNFAIFINKLKNVLIVTYQKLRVIRPKQNNVVFPVTRPTHFFRPDWENFVKKFCLKKIIFFKKIFFLK